MSARSPVTPSQPPAPRQAAPPVSRLAIAAAVAAAVACCPAASLLGIALGVAAALRVGASQGRLRGRRLAMVAVGVGAIGLILQGVLVERFNERYRSEIDASMVRRVERAMAALQRGDVAGVEAAWAELPQPLRPDEIGAFAGELRSRYGRFQAISIAKRTPGGTLAAPTMDVAATFSFERRELTGGATFALVPVTGRLFPETPLIELVLDDPELGRLALPSSGEAGTITP